MRIFICSGSFFHLIIFLKDVMNVSWNLKIVGWKKKNHNFLLHYNQLRGSRNQQLPFNGLRCGAIFYYYINFYQDNYDKKIVKDFSNSVYERFVSGKDFKIQGYVEIINYQQTEIVNLENTRVWLTNVFKGTCWWSYRQQLGFQKG